MSGIRSGAVTDESTMRAAQSEQIWGEERACSGKFTKRRLVMASVVILAVVLILGLSLGLSKSSDDSTSRAVGQADDPAAIGCYVDERHSRVMTDKLTDEELTPTVSVLTTRMYTFIPSGRAGGYHASISQMWCRFLKRCMCGCMPPRGMSIRNGRGYFAQLNSVVCNV